MDALLGRAPATPARVAARENESDDVRELLRRSREFDARLKVLEDVVGIAPVRPRERDG